ncbi:MAG: hypothetical protein LBH73_01935, partial [Spirochaetaceae bacterium]|nr:hypothetical protein [Spirochaetaceae bacterium]
QNGAGLSRILELSRNSAKLDALAEASRAMGKTDAAAFIAEALLSIAREREDAPCLGSKAS